MDFMMRAGLFLIERVYEPVAQYTERKVGIGCFGLAYICAALGASGILASLSMMGVPVPSSVMWASMLISVLFIFLLGRVEKYRRCHAPAGTYRNQGKQPEYLFGHMATAGFVVIAMGGIGLMVLMSAPSWHIIGWYGVFVLSGILSASSLFFISCDVSARSIDKEDSSSR